MHDVPVDKLSSCESFPELLQLAFEHKKSKNPRLSMRSFAVQLELDQSLLCKVLQGKRSLSVGAMDKCLRKLGLTEKNIQECLSRFSSKIIYHREIEEDVFSVISEWYHFAVLELLKIKTTVHTAESISERLNVDADKIECALERLERFEFIHFKDGKYNLSKPNNTWTSHSATSEARRKLQEDLLQKSLWALKNVKIEDRHHSSYTFAVSKEKLPELKEKIFEMTVQLGNFANQSENFDDVYQLTFSMFPLTGLKEKT